MDPLCEPSLHSVAEKHKVFDYSSYIIECLKNTECFETRPDVALEVSVYQRRRDPSINPTHPQFWQWCFAHAHLFSAVEVLLTEYTTAEMSHFWNMTFARWEAAVKPFSTSKGLKPFDPHEPKFLKELPGPDFQVTEEEQGWLTVMREWAAVAFFTKHKLSDKELRQLHTAKALPGVKKLDLWYPVSDVGLLDQDPLLKVHRFAAPPRLRQCPPARMLYRNFGWNSRTSKTRQVTADAHCMLCCLGFRYHVATTGQLLLTEEGPQLRAMFLQFLSRFCQPTLDNFLGPEDQRSAALNVQWVSWDAELLDDLKDRARQLAPPSNHVRVSGVSLSPEARLAALERQRKYQPEIQHIIATVEKAVSASGAPGDSHRVHEHVHRALQGLVGVRTSVALLARGMPLIQNCRPCLTTSTAWRNGRPDILALPPLSPRALDGTAVPCRCTCKSPTPIQHGMRASTTFLPVIHKLSRNTAKRSRNSTPARLSTT